jgi:hypothetical protein
VIWHVLNFSRKTRNVPVSTPVGAEAVFLGRERKNPTPSNVDGDGRVA